jgi:hypothetical protein
LPPVHLAENKVDKSITVLLQRKFSFRKIRVAVSPAVLSVIREALF